MTIDFDHVPFQVKCRAGEYDTKDDSEIYPTQERGVRLIQTHDEFFRGEACAIEQYGFLSWKNNAENIVGKVREGWITGQLTYRTKCRNIHTRARI